MSRSGYVDDGDDTWSLIRWRGAVNSAIRGKRGQQMLRETLAALDALPEKKLAAESLINADGEYCTLGALGRMRGIDMSNIDPEESDEVASAFGIAPALAREIVYMNDEYINEFEWRYVDIVGPMRPCERRERSYRFYLSDTGQRRFKHMRDWIEKQIKPVISLTS